AGVRSLGLFGSFARNEQTPESDLDVLVEFDPLLKTFDNFMKVSLLLEDLCDRRVDLVTTESLSPYLRPHIVSEVEYVSLTG
ncbi:MAG: nucleotidyltransferase family protein, partial [Blastocatellia bacterium]